LFRGRCVLAFDMVVDGLAANLSCEVIFVVRRDQDADEIRLFRKTAGYEFHAVAGGRARQTFHVAGEKAVIGGEFIPEVDMNIRLIRLGSGLMAIRAAFGKPVFPNRRKRGLNGLLLLAGGEKENR